MKSEVIQDGTGNYLRISEADREEISDKIFSYQEIPGFLPLELRRINGQKEYLYNISGRVSLKRYLEKGDFSLKDIQYLFRQIFDMQDCMEEYLLDSRGVVIQEDCLYLDAITGIWEGIYSTANKKGISESVGRLLESIMEKMDQRDRELVFFVYGMHKLTRGADCTRDMLREYVSGDEPEDREQIPESDSPDSEPVPFLPGERKRPHKKLMIRGCLLPGMILAAGISLPSILWWMGMFRLPLSGATDWGKAAGAGVFFLAVAGYGVWKTMPERFMKKEKDHVVYWEEAKEENRVCLIPQMGSGDIMPVPRFPFRIRQGNRNGDEHTQVRIVQEAGTVMIVDEESAMGIFRNDRKLVPWQKTPLEDGDLLRIGEQEYVVEITQPEYVI